MQALLKFRKQLSAPVLHVPVPLRYAEHITLTSTRFTAAQYDLISLKFVVAQTHIFLPCFLLAAGERVTACILLTSEIIPSDRTPFRDVRLRNL